MPLGNLVSKYHIYEERALHCPTMTRMIQERSLYLCTFVCFRYFQLLCFPILTPFINRRSHIHVNCLLWSSEYFLPLFVFNCLLPLTYGTNIGNNENTNIGSFAFAEHIAIHRSKIRLIPHRVCSVVGGWYICTQYVY